MVYRGGPVLAGSLILGVALAAPSSPSSQVVLRPADSSAVIVRGQGPKWRPASGRQGRPATDNAAHFTDFNCDGLPDYATTSPVMDVPNSTGQLIQDAGAAFVAHGKRGAKAAKGEMLTILAFGIEPRFGDQFGWSSAVGDVDGDGCTELLVGANGFNGVNGALPNAGGLFLYRGSPSGLVPDLYIEGTVAGELLGTSAALCNFDGKPGLEAAASAPGRTVDGFANAGVIIEFFIAAMLQGADPEPKEIGVDDLKGALRANDFTGWKVSASYVNDDAYCDLGVGSEFANQGRGEFRLLFGTRKGLSKRGNQLVTLKGAQIGDQWGHDFVFPYLDLDAFADPTISAPLANGGEGLVISLFGGPKGVTSLSLALEYSETEPGDAFGWALEYLGEPGSNLFFFGMPGVDPVIDGDVVDQGGGVSWSYLDIQEPQNTFGAVWDELKIGRRGGPSRPQETTWGPRSQAGYDLNVEMLERPGLYRLDVGVPGLTVDGVDRAGANDPWIVKFDPDKGPRTLTDRINVGGNTPPFPGIEPQENAGVGRAYAARAPVW